jgi:hypothetical protein
MLASGYRGRCGLKVSPASGERNLCTSSEGGQQAVKSRAGDMFTGIVEIIGSTNILVFQLFLSDRANAQQPSLS